MMKKTTVMALMVLLGTFLFATLAYAAPSDEDPFFFDIRVDDELGEGIGGVVLHLSYGDELIEYQTTDFFGQVNFSFTWNISQKDNLNLRIYSAPDNFEFSPEPIVLTFDEWEHPDGGYIWGVSVDHTLYFIDPAYACAPYVISISVEDEAGDGVNGVVVHLYEHDELIEYQTTRRFVMDYHAARFYVRRTQSQAEHLTLRISSAPEGFELYPGPIIPSFQRDGESGRWRFSSRITLPPPTNGSEQPPAGARILRFPIGSTTFTDAGTTHTLEAAPFVANGRTMVPLRVIIEALGATDLQFVNGVVTFNLDGVAFSLPIGQELPGGMGTPVIIANRTFVPLAFIINGIDGNARWDAEARAAYVYL